MGKDRKAAGQGCLVMLELTGAPVSQDALTSVCGFNLVREGWGRGGRRGGIPGARRACLLSVSLSPGEHLGKVTCPPAAPCGLGRALGFGVGQAALTVNPSHLTSIN